MYLALVQAADTVGDDLAVLRTLVVLDNWVGAATVPAGVAMFIGATGAILTTRALPAWVGWLAGVTGLLMVVSLGAVFDNSEEGVLGFAGFGGFLLVPGLGAGDEHRAADEGRSRHLADAPRAGSRRAGRLTG